MGRHGKCAWLTTLGTGPGEIDVGGTPMHRVDEMRILGRLFDLRATEERTLEEGLAKAGGPSGPTGMSSSVSKCRRL